MWSITMWLHVGMSPRNLFSGSLGDNKAAFPCGEVAASVASLSGRCEWCELFVRLLKGGMVDIYHSPNTENSHLTFR